MRWRLFLLSPLLKHLKNFRSDRIIRTITNDIVSWQQQFNCSSCPLDRPFVTITYAQSLDGKIALVLKEKYRNEDSALSKTSSNFALSDPASFRMTHALRSIHDGILVGGTTLSIDNPRLNNRLWAVAGRKRQPRPIVLDTHLKHVRALGKQCRATNVIACCSQEAAAIVNVQDLPDSMELLPCKISPQTGRMDLADVLKQLKQKHNIQSLMVEGGASVLTAFFRQPELVDCICITVAPKMLLWNGLPALSSGYSGRGNGTTSILDHDSFASSRFSLLGKDAIFLGKLAQ